MEKTLSVLVQPRRLIISISIIIPVYNEVMRINRLIGQLLELKEKHTFESREFTEIIVVDGDPQGNTISRIQNPEILTLISPKGRATQMNHGAGIAKGKTLLFLHADTSLPVNGLQKIKETMESGTYAGGAFKLLTTRLHWFQKYLYYSHYLRSKLFGIPYGDQAIFISRDCFSQLGGYREIPLMEDVDLMKRLKRSAFRIRILKDCVYSSTRRYDEEGMFYCMIRNNKIRLLYNLGVSPEKLARMYPDTRRNTKRDTQELMIGEKAVNDKSEVKEEKRVPAQKGIFLPAHELAPESSE